MEEYPNLFSPIQINGMTLKNRIVMAPMASHLATQGGYISDRTIGYYRTRAAGGAAMITLEGTAIDPDGVGWSNNIGIYDDRFLPGLRALTEAIHAEGAKACVEIFHAGCKAPVNVTAHQAISASAIRPYRGEVPREMTQADIDRTVAEFAAGAARAKEAGFDAVNLHMAHGYLIFQFFSPLSNHRTDAYGGPLENRCRFAVEVVRAVRAAVGSDFPILCRLSADEGAGEIGIQIGDAKKIARILEDAGADLIDVSAGGNSCPGLTVQPMSFPVGGLLPLAAAIKSVVKLPVSAVGRINSPAVAEAALAEGKADVIVMGRPLICDPELPNKAQQGRDDEIQTCIGCKLGCSGRNGAGVGLSCLCNPRAGREFAFPMEPAKTAKRVLVAGGGPAGMQAAVTAAERGHTVRLLESAPKLGGQANLAGVVAFKHGFDTFVGDQAKKLERLGVEVLLNTPCTQEQVDAFAPDAFIEAVGAKPTIPPIPGLNSAPDVRLAWDVLSDEKPSEWKTAFVIGGGEVGCETAEHLAAQGVAVYLVELLATLGSKMGIRDRDAMTLRMRETNIQVYTNSMIRKVEGRDIWFSEKGVDLVIRDVDGIVLAGGAKPNALEVKLPEGTEYAKIGDCIAPARMYDAVSQGFFAAYQL